MAIVPLNGARRLRLTIRLAVPARYAAAARRARGGWPSLFAAVLRENAFSLLFLPMMMGVSLAAVRMFAVLTGAWVFGECDLTTFALRLLASSRCRAACTCFLCSCRCPLWRLPPAVCGKPRITRIRWRGV